MKKMGATMFVYYTAFQSFIYALLSWVPVEIDYFSPLFSYVIDSELKTELNNQHNAIFLLGYWTMISGCMIFVSRKCFKNNSVFYFFYTMLLVVHSITFIYSIYISIMSIYNLAYIQTDKFTELLREKFHCSSNVIQILFQCCGFRNTTTEYNVTLPHTCKDFLGCTFEKIYKVTCKDPMISAFASLIKSIGCVAITSFFIELGFFLTVYYSWFPSDHNSLASAVSDDSLKNDVNANKECIIMEKNLK